MNSPKTFRLRGLVLSVLLAGLLSGCAGSDEGERESASPAPSAEADGRTASASASEPAAPPVPARSVDATDLALGDCFSNPPADEEQAQLTEVDVFPCDQPHEQEVYALTTLPAGEFPGEDAVDTEAQEFCSAEFEGYVGQAFGSSELEAAYIVPSLESWQYADDREIVCTVLGPMGEPSSESFRDADR